ncbi:zinc finger protein 862-like [Haliotis rufescens]|uniref:zinc finger protein 862-like n=1 Tax=Haliotis rufescens TaxID=6454 RepID=UPI00201F26B4|nr:zinc finger protein 862-like [Haliotis rufescens]
MSQRSILSFFGGGDELKRKAEGNSESCISAKNKKYDECKRKRTFIDGWKDQFPWVAYNDTAKVMKCTICSKYPNIHACNRKRTFIDGCSNFRIEYLKSHDTSDAHLECMSYERDAQRRSTASGSCDVTTPLSGPTCSTDNVSPIVKALQNSDKQTMQKLEKLFITAFHVAYRGKPLSDFEFNLDLLDCVGVDIGSKYRNIAGAREFIKAIACSLQKEFIPELKKARFVTILSDGSTDSAILEQETVFMRYVSHGQPVSFHAGTVPLEHCHADEVLDGIRKAVESVDICFDDLLSTTEASGPSLVSVNFDGAAVMLGSKGGVAAKICKQAKHVVPVHCVAHKLELAVLDAVKHLPSLSNFEDVLKQVFKFYHYSPKMRRELKTVSDIFNTDLANLSDVKQVRWLASKIRAVRALKISFHSILNHFESVAAGRSDQSAKCQGWLRKMKTVSFVKTMCILLDILPILTEVSLVFQKEDLLIIEVPSAIEGLVMKLLNCKIDPVGAGESMEYFSKMYNHEKSSFDGVKLNGVCPPVIFKDDTFLISLVDGIITYLDKRFSCFKQKPLKHFSVFDFTEWPTQREPLSVYGSTDLSELMEHFSFLHICKLVELMLVVSPGTSICERMFSSMNLVKTHHRTALHQKTLCHTLTIMTHGSKKLADFDPRPAIMEWLHNTPGSRHILSLAKEAKPEPVPMLGPCSSKCVD